VSGKTEKVTLKRLPNAKFEARNAAGIVTLLEGGPAEGGTGDAVRPMQMVLMGLAGCSAIDVVHILHKGRFTIDSLELEVEGQRADRVPAVYTDVHMRFAAGGDFDADRLERAVALSVDKYCSVAHMLMPSVEITWSAEKV
jgi:putative redox protein